MRKLILIVFLSVLFYSAKAQSKQQFTINQTNESYAGIISSGSSAADLKVLKISLKDDLYSDETVIAFKKGYDSTYQTSDGDAPYMTGAAISISSLTSDNKNMAINFMPDISDVKEIKLSINAKTSKNAELTITELPEENYQFVLKDKYLNTEKVLKKGLTYKFAIDKSAKSSFGTDRFLVVITSINNSLANVTKSTNEDISLTFFPNPAINTLYIKQNESASQLIEASIYNISGGLVKKTNITPENLSMDVTDLLSGSYIVILKDIRTGIAMVRSQFLKQ